MPLYVTCASRSAIALPELLASRDARQARQQQWLSEYATSLISFTTVAPGPFKDSELSRRIFNHGIRSLRQMLAASGWEIVQQRCVGLITGAEGLLAVDAPALTLKQACIALEQNHPLGRLWDIDVFTPQGELLTRQTLVQPARRCLLCGKDARICARDRAHSATELVTQMERLLNDAENTRPR